MIPLSAALIAVAALAYLGWREWLKFKRQQYEDSVNRVVSADVVTKLAAELGKVRNLANATALKVGLQGLTVTKE